MQKAMIRNKIINQKVSIENTRTSASKKSPKWRVDKRMSMGVKSHLKLSSQIVNATAFNNRASTTLMNSRKHSLSKWYFHRGQTLKQDLCKSKYKLKFNNSDCFPLIRDQYSRFINCSRQTNRKSTPLSFFSNYNIHFHNNNRIK